VKAGLRRRLPALVIGGALLGVMAGCVAFVVSLMDDEVKSPKKIVQVQVFRPPPPPPPELEPPPPEVEEEVELPEPEPVAEAPDVPDVPAGELLGLDADGVAGSDAFGLVGRKGGRDLIGGAPTYQWYASRIKDEVLDYLAGRDDVRKSEYSVVVHIWVGGDGRLSKYRLASSSGNADLDRALADALASLSKFDQPPPNDMPQPVRLRIVSRV
jgi:protein TonB